MDIFKVNPEDLPDELKQLIAKEKHPSHQRYHKAVEELTPKPSDMLGFAAKMMELSPEERNSNRVYHYAMAFDDALDWVGDTSQGPNQALRTATLMMMLERYGTELRRDLELKAKLADTNDKEGGQR